MSSCFKTVPLPQTPSNKRKWLKKKNTQIHVCDRNVRESPSGEWGSLGDSGSGSKPRVAGSITPVGDTDLVESSVTERGVKPGPGVSACESRLIKWLPLCLGLLLCEKTGPSDSGKNLVFCFVCLF